jgi:DNA-binding LacI/PurR family transcriptional regulator
MLLSAMATTTQDPQARVLPTELVVRRTTAPPLSA